VNRPLVIELALDISTYLGLYSDQIKLIERSIEHDG